MRLRPILAAVAAALSACVAAPLLPPPEKAELDIRAMCTGGQFSGVQVATSGKGVWRVTFDPADADCGT